MAPRFVPGMGIARKAPYEPRGEAAPRSPALGSFRELPVPPVAGWGLSGCHPSTRPPLCLHLDAPAVTRGPRQMREEPGLALAPGALP